MNLRAEIASLLAADRPIPEALFLRPDDGQRVDGLLQQLLHQGLSLALSSRHAALLDHCADLLVHQLRARAACPVEICFPASTAALVARFERTVAGLALGQALREPARAAPERIWLVHDAGALAAAELQLLVRLVSSLPGAGVRLVLLFGPSLRSRAAFAGLGRRFATWDIEPPTAAQARAQRALARTQDLEALVAELQASLPLAPSIEADRLADVAEATAAPAPAPAAPRPWWRRAWPGRTGASRATPLAPAGPLLGHSP